MTRPPPRSGCCCSPAPAPRRLSGSGGSGYARRAPYSHPARPGRAACRWENPREPSSTHFPARGLPMRACSRPMPRGTANRDYGRAGNPSAKSPASAARGCTTCATPSRVRPSCRAGTCRWSGACSDTGATAPQRVTLTSPAINSTRRQNAWGNTLLSQWQILPEPNMSAPSSGNLCNDPPIVMPRH